MHVWLSRHRIFDIAPYGGRWNCVCLLAPVHYLVWAGLQELSCANTDMLPPCTRLPMHAVPYALWGFVFILLTQAFLLPGNSSRYAKDLLIAVRVLPSSSVAKKKLKDSGLLQQSGFSVSGIYRDGKYLSKPDPNWVLEPNDILYAAGEFDVVEFVGEEVR